MSKRYDYKCFIDGAVFINIENDCEFDMESACELLNEQDQKIADLEVKLSEKEKEIENLNNELIGMSYSSSYQEFLVLREELKVEQTINKVLVERENEFKQLLAEKEKEITQRLVIQERDYNQDKISFALEQLEKVKEYIKTNLISFQKVPIIQELNNQIKQLKEMK